MSETDPDLQTELKTLTDHWERIVEVPETPRSVMSVIEYSLGAQRRAEVYVNSLLRYFLDPDAPHGMREELLRTFLNELPAETEFTEDIHDLSKVQVADQVSIRNTSKPAGDTPGYVDLVIEAPNEWFLLVEIKFGAGENNLDGPGASQTEFYYRATHFDDQPKSDFESGHYYLFIHPDDEPPARECEFTNWTWEEITSSLIEPFLLENAPRYPHRTVVQLRELLDDVQEIIGMTEHQATQQEKIELYLDHYEAIQDVRAAFEDRWEAFAENWPNRLRQALENDGIDTTGWHFRAHNIDWGHIFKHGWWRRQSDLESISDRDVGNDARVQLIHRLEGNREAALGDRTLYFYFRNAGSNDQTFIEAFDENFTNAETEIQNQLPDASELTGEKRNLIEAEYDIRVDENNDFFEAYIEALKRAFIDHVTENDELVAELDSVYEDAIEIYR